MIFGHLDDLVEASEIAQVVGVSNRFDRNRFDRNGISSMAVQSAVNPGDRDTRGGRRPPVALVLDDIPRLFVRRALHGRPSIARPGKVNL